MHLSARNLSTAAVLVAALVPALAHEKTATPSTKETANARLVGLAREIAALRTSGADEVQLAQLRDEHQRLAGILRGDHRARARTLRSAAGSPSTATAALALPPTCGAAPTTTSFAGTSGPLADATPLYSPATFTANVAGLGAALWDVNLNLAITHSFTSDLDILLTSPAGTTITISIANGGGNDNIFNGTTFDDNVNDPVTDKVFTNNVAATPLSPEGRLSKLRGENPNGTWTLTVGDYAGADTGSVNSWSLDITTVAAVPVASSTTLSTSPALPLNAGTPVQMSTLVAGGLGTYLSEVELYVEVPHNWSDDVDITLASPLGPTVTASSNNSFGHIDVFNGTLLDADAPTTITGYAYVDFVAATPAQEEGSFDNWLGQDPNGTWTITVRDDYPPFDDGSFNRWDLTLRTITPPTPSAPTNFAGTTGPIPDYVSGELPGTSTFTSTVTGVGASLFDVDVTTAITHSYNEDLDITLTSPNGTTVVLSSANGPGEVDIFNGTLWDDNVNDPVTDYAFVSPNAATPLSPEGRLAAFRGENPNGVWTLSITDTATLETGALSSWSLAVSTIPAAQAEVSSTLSQSPALAIVDNTTVSDTIVAAGFGNAVTEVELYMEITHSWCADMDITLTSPLGTTVPVTTGNGGTLNNLYNGTLLDPDVLVPITDGVFVNNVASTPHSPEGSFDNFVGQTANGNWTLSITDTASGDSGTLARWDLTLRTCGNPPPVPYCFGDGTGTACPCTPVPLVGDPDKGCPNGFNAGGGKLTASGNSSISGDTLVMTCTTINNGGAVVFQGTNNNGGGLGVAFGDGLRCAAGVVRRMKSHAVTTNTHQYPDPMFGDNAISIRGAVLAAGDRWYQGWYRSGLAHCNPTQNYNLTNGVKVTWVP